MQRVIHLREFLRTTDDMIAQYHTWEAALPFHNGKFSWFGNMTTQWPDHIISCLYLWTGWLIRNWMLLHSTGNKCRHTHCNLLSTEASMKQFCLYFYFYLELPHDCCILVGNIAELVEELLCWRSGNLKVDRAKKTSKSSQLPPVQSVFQQTVMFVSYLR